MFLDNQCILGARYIFFLLSFIVYIKYFIIKMSVFNRLVYLTLLLFICPTLTALLQRQMANKYMYHILFIFIQTVTVKKDFFQYLFVLKAR